MADLTVWQHFEEIQKLLEKINNFFYTLEQLKIDILHNPELRVGLKKIVAVHSNLVIKDLLEQYTHFMDLKRFLEDNGYIYKA